MRPVPTPRQPRDSRKKLIPRSGLRSLGQRLRRRGRCIVFTNACFDHLHPGHVGLLERARRKGDWLIVGLNSDSSVTQLKGKNRPILKQRDRAMMLAALECVDFVTIFPEPTPLITIQLLKPDILIKGAEWSAGAIVGGEEVLAGGGQVLRLPPSSSISTTRVIEIARRGTRGQKTPTARSSRGARARRK